MADGTHWAGQPTLALLRCHQCRRWNGPPLRVPPPGPRWGKADGPIKRAGQPHRLLEGSLARNSGFLMRGKDRWPTRRSAHSRAWLARTARDSKDSADWDAFRFE